MNLESPKHIIGVSARTAFEFLSRVDNYEKIMPDSMEKFQRISEERFLFSLKGMPEIVLEIKERHPNDKVVLGSASEKLPFTLTGLIAEKASDSCEVQLVFAGDFNPMMAMMIQGPIKEFIHTLSANMDRIGG